MSIKSFVRSTLKHSKIIIALTILITIFMGWKATQIELDTDVNSLMPKQNDRIEKLQQELGDVQETRNYLFLSIHGYDLYKLETLETFQNTIDAIIEIPEIEAALTPFNSISFQAQNSQILPSMVSPTGRAPVSVEELKAFKEKIEKGSLSENFVVAEHGRILTAVFTSSFVDDLNAFTARVNAAIEPLQKIVTVHRSGEVLVQKRISYYLLKDFSILLILAIVAISMIFWLSFRSVRAVILPVLVVIVGGVWTLGVMSIMGYAITVITVIIPSLVLTIGSSYTIHILNEYSRKGNDTGKPKMEWLTDAVVHVVKTIMIAALTTMICFMSLLITRLDPLREFGLAISLGIAFCGMLSLFFLPAVLYHLKPMPEYHRKKVDSGFLTKSVLSIGKWAHRRHHLVLVLFVLLFVVSLLCYPRILHQSDYFSYFPSDDPVIAGSRFINQHSGGSQTFNITLTAKNKQKNYFLEPEILRKVDLFETVVNAHPSVTNKLSFSGILKAMNKSISGVDAIPASRGLMLLLYRYFGLIAKEKVAFGQESSIINREASSITIYLKLAESESFNLISEDGVRQFVDFVNEEIEASFDDSVEAIHWGNTLLILESSRLVKRGQVRSTLISIVLGMLITWAFIQSLVYSLMVVIPLMSGIFFYFITLYIVGIPLDMTTMLVTSVTVGVGLDDAVHFILQYRKQRMKHPYVLAVENTLKFTGWPIVLTTLSLAAGLLMLCFASFKPIFFFGFLVAGTLFSTMIGTIVFIPAAITFYEKFKERRLSS